MLAVVNETVGDVQLTPEQRDRVARYVIARMEDLGLDREKIARRAGINRATVERVENGGAVRSTNMTLVERALGWPAGMVRHIADGGEPATFAPTEREQETPARPPVQVTSVRHGSLQLLIAALADVDEDTQQDIIDAALAAYRASKRRP